MANCFKKRVFEAYTDNHFSVSRDSDDDGIMLNIGCHGKRHEVFFWDHDLHRIIDCLKTARKKWKIEENCNY